ncbi:NlpC/P60 family protein [Aquipuribacter nitratireducens]|uniref:NlpC/P60 family protein n=1 Tax=Aquipuribacter nitratireducens TaxID=650104 RepID=A0ABW0GP57_9MICO
MRLPHLPSAVRVLAATAAVTLSFGLLAAPAGASDVAEAEQRVEELGRQVAVLTEDYNEMREEAAAQRTRAEAAAAQVSDQQVRIGDMNDELVAFAVEAFKRGGVDPRLALLLRGGSDFSHGSGTIALLGERSSASLSRLRQAQTELLELQREEQRALADVEAMEADLAATKQDIETQLAAAEDDLERAEAAAAAREAARQAAIRAAEQRRAAAEAASRSREAAASSDSGGSGESGGSGGSGGSGDSGDSGGSGGTEVVVSGGTTVSCGGRSVTAPDNRTATVIAFACSQMGKPYQWGAGGPSSYDCSGLTSRAWAQVGVSLPHSSRMQYSSGAKVSRDQLRPGDLVYFYSPISHVGIYIGGGELVAAPSSGDVVKIQSMRYMPYAGGTRH